MGNRIIAQQRKLAVDDDMWVMLIDSDDLQHLISWPRNYIESKYSTLQARFRDCATDIVLVVEYFEKSENPSIEETTFPFTLHGIDRTDIITLSVPYSKSEWTPAQSIETLNDPNFLPDSDNKRWKSFIDHEPEESSSNTITVLNTEKSKCLHVTRINGNNNVISIYDIITQPSWFFNLVNRWAHYSYSENGNKFKVVDEDKLAFLPADLEAFRIVIHMPIDGFSRNKAETCCKTCPPPKPFVAGSKEVTVQTLILAAN